MSTINSSVITPGLDYNLCLPVNDVDSATVVFFHEVYLQGAPRVSLCLISFIHPFYSNANSLVMHFCCITRSFLLLFLYTVLLLVVVNEMC